MIYKLSIALLVGFIGGIIFWERYGIGNTYRNYISKIKGKGKSVLDVVFKPVIGITKSRKDLRKEKKAKKKSEPKLTRKERKQAELHRMYGKPYGS